MEKNIIRLMNHFNPNGLIDRFVQLYIFEFGSDKIEEINYKVINSNDVSLYINNLFENNIHPSPYGLQKILHNNLYFAVAKEEHLCMGSIFVFANWLNELEFRLDLQDPIELNVFQNKLTPILSELIYDCGKRKIIKSNSFFEKFYKVIREIHQA